jgi:hypothetical protein
MSEQGFARFSRIPASLCQSVERNVLTHSDEMIEELGAEFASNAPCQPAQSRLV